MVFVEELWKKAIEFHGHECPGLAIGFKAALAAREYLGCKQSGDEEIVCISENDACGIDGIQVVLSCTMGKGNLLLRMTGKSVYHFFNRENGKSIRIYVKSKPFEMDREGYKRYLLESDFEEIFEITDTKLRLPEKARIFKSLKCEVCGEFASEQYIRIEEGKKVCLDCFNKYERFYEEY
ncbi:TPA: TraR/DksA C4-type zinc finger protein [Clostridioides difficile]|uniref:FmdE family protein n=1 Tax=Clostridioides difficile TaxID=1496 RepID=UPI0009401AFE|nr:FmdE family protein [Clostridioides difficile]MBN5983694.1 TraR/DksA C4-type zinc finger protein [Clostridioides difficile]MCJ0309317.1 TraR/DksA C4-type zinc finger protein [Clostridioides difficile]MCJ0377415.1 TraR/DksA C4-type zinc finger protein [Clostridioides difficile]MCJ0410480.1 TraR/DksA C4-type zinc finger protein [Clostridioides difficile]MCO8702675.1 TraR/DksA C4-type zinc finger protein [Clostridioides difficile]